MNYNSLLKVVKHFSDETVCRKHLENAKWGGDPICPKCNHPKAYWIKSSRLYECADSNCRKKFSHIVGTIFENSNIPLSTWFVAIYLITAHKKGISSHQLARDIDVTQKTAWFMLHRVREMMNTSFGEILVGEVEADETYIGGKEKFKHKKDKTEKSQGRSLKTKTPVFGMVQRKGIVVTKKVDDVKQSTIQPIIRQNVEIGSTLYSDEWWAYNKLSAFYDHGIVKHREGEFVRGNIHTNTIEGFWSLLKRGILGIYHHVSPKHLQRYCDEFTFRYNTILKDKSGYKEVKGAQEVRFNLALASSVNRRLTYKDLIAKE
jgi:transposase-like protein